MPALRTMSRTRSGECGSAEAIAVRNCKRFARYVPFNRQSVEVTVLPSGLVTVRPLVVLFPALPVIVTLIEVGPFQVKLFTA
jgi:hypothetical protein